VQVEADPPARGGHEEAHPGTHPRIIPSAG
jgi:hypothetical protein